MTFTALFSRVDQAGRARLEPIARRARLAWLQRSPREQKLLRAAALLIVAALLWMLAISPAMQTIAKAQRTLPVLQSQATQLDAVILEAQALGRGRSGALPADETEAALKATLQSAGLEATSVLTSHDAEHTHWQVQFTNAPAVRIVEWMAGLPFVVQVQTREVSLARSNVDGRDRPGQLSGTIVLALTQAEGS